MEGKTLNQREIREYVLTKLGDGVEYDSERCKLILRGLPRITRSLTGAEREGPNIGKLRDPNTGVPDYPMAASALKHGEV